MSGKKISRVRLLTEIFGKKTKLGTIIKARDSLIDTAVASGDYSNILSMMNDFRLANKLEDEPDSRLDSSDYWNKIYSEIKGEAKKRSLRTLLGYNLRELSEGNTDNILTSSQINDQPSPKTGTDTPGTITMTKKIKKQQKKK